MANIQLYSLGSPNGIKIPVALEEMGLEYDVHTVDILKGEQHNAEFKQINPNAKIPAIVDLEYCPSDYGISGYFALFSREIR